MSLIRSLRNLEAEISDCLERVETSKHANTYIPESVRKLSERDKNGEKVKLIEFHSNHMDHYGQKSRIIELDKYEIIMNSTTLL